MLKITMWINVSQTPSHLPGMAVIYCVKSVRNTDSRGRLEGMQRVIREPWVCVRLIR